MIIPTNYIQNFAEYQLSFKITHQNEVIGHKWMCGALEGHATWSTKIIKEFRYLFHRAFKNTYISKAVLSVR